MGQLWRRRRAGRNNCDRRRMMVLGPAWGQGRKRNWLESVLTLKGLPAWFGSNQLLDDRVRGERKQCLEEPGELPPPSRAPGRVEFPFAGLGKTVQKSQAGPHLRRQHPEGWSSRLLGWGRWCRNKLEVGGWGIWSWMYRTSTGECTRRFRSATRWYPRSQIHQSALRASKTFTQGEHL